MDDPTKDTLKRCADCRALEWGLKWHYLGGYLCEWCYRNWGGKDDDD